MSAQRFVRAVDRRNEIVSESVLTIEEGVDFEGFLDEFRDRLERRGVSYAFIIHNLPVGLPAPQKEAVRPDFGLSRLTRFFRGVQDFRTA